MNYEISVLYVPCSDEQEAASIGRSLVLERLAACANIVQSRSIYSWEGRMHDGAEAILICKTTALRERAARARIRELHSYDVPCILSWPSVRTNAEYAQWLHGEVQGVGGSMGEPR